METNASEPKSNEYVKVTASGPVAEGGVRKSGNDFTIKPEPGSSAPITVQVELSDAAKANPNYTLQWPLPGMDPSQDLREGPLAYRVIHAGEPDINGTIGIAIAKVTRVPQVLFTSARNWTPVRFTLEAGDQEAIEASHIKQLVVTLHYKGTDGGPQAAVFSGLHQYVARMEGGDANQNEFEVYINPIYYGRYTPLPESEWKPNPEGSYVADGVVSDAVITGSYADAWFSIRAIVQRKENDPTLIVQSKTAEPSKNDNNMRIIRGLFGLETFALDIPHADQRNPEYAPYGPGELTRNAGVLIDLASDHRPFFAYQADARWDLVKSRALVTYLNADDPYTDNSGNSMSQWLAPKLPRVQIPGGPLDGEDAFKPNTHEQTNAKLESKVTFNWSSQFSDAVSSMAMAHSRTGVYHGSGTYAGRSVNAKFGAGFFLSYGTRYITNTLGQTQTPDSATMPIPAMDLDHTHPLDVQIRVIRGKPRYYASVSNSDDSDGKLITTGLGVATTAARLASSSHPVASALMVATAAFGLHRAVLVNREKEDAQVRMNSYTIVSAAPYDLSKPIPSLHAVANAAESPDSAPDSLRVNQVGNTTDYIQESPFDVYQSFTAPPVGSLVLGFVQLSTAIRARTGTWVHPHHAVAHAEFRSNIHDSDTAPPGTGARTFFVRIRPSPYP